MLAETPIKNIIPIALPTLGDEEIDAVANVIRTGWVSQGPQVKAFESEFAAYVGSQYACAVSNCTTALHLALLAVGVGTKDEVITVSHSFIATANAIRHCGATPVFVDIDPEMFNLEPQLIESAITDRTKAILCVHQLGMPCDIKAIIKIATKYNLPVIEDAACAIGSQIKCDGNWEQIGKPHGDIACFSFHPRKVITTGEGGMLTTNNPKWDQLFRLWRQHGMSVSDSIRHNASNVIFEEYPVVGYNYRLTDLQAAIGRKQLERLPSIINQRRLIAKLYCEYLLDVEEITPPFEPSWARSNWQSYAIRLSTKFNQKEIMQTLLDLGVSTRRGVMCSHREQAYDDIVLNHALIQSEKAQNQTILLPIYPQLSEENVTYIVKSLKNAIAQHA